MFRKKRALELQVTKPNLWSTKEQREQAARILAVAFHDAAEKGFTVQEIYDEYLKSMDTFISSQARQLRPAYRAEVNRILTEVKRGFLDSLPSPHSVN